MEIIMEETKSDPTQLTTSQLQREIEHVKEIYDGEIGGIKASIKLAHEDLVRVPTDVQKQVGNLREIHEEKFHSIEKQFRERDVRSEQQATSTKTAIDAALASQDKSATKQEASFTKQIDGLQTQLQDLKDRVTTVEGIDRGKQNQSQSSGVTMSRMIAGAAVLIALISLLSRFMG